MKKVILLALLMVGTAVIAQGKHREQRHKNQIEHFTPEQRNELMVKKMTLELDLNASQQKEISKLLSEKLAKKESYKAERKSKKTQRTKPTSDERFAMKSKMLDEQIATKKRMEKILNAKQYEKWVVIKEDFHNNRRNNKGNLKQKHLQNQERIG